MNNNCYDKQRERANFRKAELVRLLGGKCVKCGYHENYAALEFHHMNPSEKSFQLDARHIANTSKELLMEEVEKCILLCSNCHKEIHHPYLSTSLVDKWTIDTGNKTRTIYKEKKKSKCPVCGEMFDSVKGKKYCSNECRKKSKGYPEKNEVMEKYKELKSQQKVAEFFGLTRKIIINILKS